jgi:hypothetical protein
VAINHSRQFLLPDIASRLTNVPVHMADVAAVTPGKYAIVLDMEKESNMTVSRWSSVAIAVLYFPALFEHPFVVLRVMDAG